MSGKDVLAIILAGLVFATQGHAQKTQPAIAGHWKLNQQRSDKLPESLREAGGLGTWGGPPSAPPAGDPREEGEGNARRPPSGARFRGGSDLGLLLEARRPPTELLIELTDTSATITDQDGRGQVLPTNGRRVEELTASSRTLRTKAEWKDRDLRIEKQVSGTDTRLRYTFRYDEITRRLTLLVRLETARAMPTEVRLVYDRAEPGDTPPAGGPPAFR